MKKIKFEGKLNLNKETVTRLGNHEMEHVNGGMTGGACEFTRSGCEVPTYQNTLECLSAANGTRCYDTSVICSS